MELEPRPGVSFAVPCRWCGTFHPVKLVEGIAPLDCEKCRRRTEVELALEGIQWRIRTRPSDGEARP